MRIDRPWNNDKPPASGNYCAAWATGWSANVSGLHLSRIFPVLLVAGIVLLALAAIKHQNTGVSRY